jgi:hypothetical protein
MSNKELIEKALELAGRLELGRSRHEADAILSLVQRVEELTADKEPQSIVWEPKLGEKYYFLLSDGKVHGSQWHHRLKTELHLNLLIHHNVYKTREQAEKAAQYQKRYNMVLQAVLNLEPNQVVDWSGMDQVKYKIYFSHADRIWKMSCVWLVDGGYPVLTVEKNVQPLLDYLNAKEVSDD